MMSYKLLVRISPIAASVQFGTKMNLLNFEVKGRRSSSQCEHVSYKHFGRPIKCTACEPRACICFRMKCVC